MVKNLKNNRKFRFGIVGVVNTAIDFGILFLLKFLGLPAIPANIISTTCAFCFSFFANKKYTFGSASSNLKRQVALFIIVTLCSVWVVQGVIIFITNPIVSQAVGNNQVGLFIAKLLATVASLIWNYVLYARVVFRR